MKTLTFTLLFILSSSTLIFSQTEDYPLTTITKTYKHLQNATVVNGTSTWDDPQFAIPLGFEFNYFDTSFTMIHFDDIGLGGELHFTDQESGSLPAIVAFSADLIDRGYDLFAGEEPSGSLSPISYITEGEEGNRIFKLEWRNAGFYGELDDDLVSTDFVNFQLWLHERDGAIEMHYGPSNITRPELDFSGQNGPSTWLISQMDLEDYVITGETYTIGGQPSNPELKVVDQYDSLTYMAAHVPDSTVYRFGGSPMSSAGINEMNSTTISFEVFPNPTTKNISVQTSEELVDVKILNQNGQVLNVHSTSPYTYDVSNLPNGIYLIQAQTATGISTEKFIKN